MKRPLAIAMVLATTIAIALAGMATATPGNPHKTAICHRTASDTNPYVYEVVDNASLDAHFNNLPGHPAKFWKSDGTFRGVAHLTGDPKNDYLAEGKDSCQDYSPSPTPTGTPTPTATPEPSGTPTPTPSAEPTATPSASPSATPTSRPPTPTLTPTPPPTSTDGAPVTSPSDAIVIFGLFFICAAAGAYLAAGRRSYK